MPDTNALNITPGQDVSVDLLRAEDAPGVAALFRAVYGDAYPVKTYYRPEELAAANQEGRIISVVARTTGGDIVGHQSFFRIAPCPKVYEGGAGLVLPSYRNTAKLLTRMIATGMEAVPRFGGQGIYGEAVCNHLFTQKAAVTLGNIPMGLALDLMPAAAYSKEDSAQGRVSSFCGFQTLKPHAHAVYLPRVYDPALRFMYEGLAEERDLRASTETPASGLASRLSMEVYDFAHVARLTAWELGADLAAVLGGLEAQAAAQGVVVSQIWLPLACPWVGWAVEELRARGWFLGGLLPRWFDSDGLLMQRLLSPPDWDSIQILLDRSREIARLVREDYQAVGKG